MPTYQKPDLTTMASLTHEMSLLNHAHLTNLERFATIQRRKYIVPFCQSYHLEFRSGNGTWAFFVTPATPKISRAELTYPRDHLVREDRLPQHILDILSLDTLTESPLGCFMDDYPLASTTLSSISSSSTVNDPA